MVGLVSVILITSGIFFFYFPEIYCPGLVLRHGYWEPYENQFYPGEQVSLHCDEGYVLIGPHTMECTMHYGWNSTEIPVCLHNYTAVKM